MASGLAEFQPSTLYGLDPVSLAGKVAQTNAIIAQTQATRQSMAARAQEMRMRQEQDERERTIFQQQQEQRNMLMPAIQAKAEADYTGALSQIELNKQNSVAQTRWNALAKTFGDEYQDILNLADDGTRANELGKFASKLVPYMHIPEAKSLQDVAHTVQQQSHNAYLENNRQAAEREKYTTGYQAAYDRVMAQQTEINQRAEEANALKKLLAEQDAKYKEIEAMAQKMKAEADMLRAQMGKGGGSAKNALRGLVGTSSPTPNTTLPPASTDQQQTPTVTPQDFAIKIPL